MRIRCLTHVPFEGPAAIADWAAARGHQLEISRSYAAEPLPDPADVDWLLIMGGPMGVHDTAEHPWLQTEKRLIRDLLDAGKTAVGICLGAQLLADALGARVYRNSEPEIGWHPIALTPAGRESPVLAGVPERLDVFHWHGDTFELPSGAVHLATSDACQHQAFLFEERVLGLQCHLESTAEGIAHIVAECADELRPAPYVQSAERMLAATASDFTRMHAELFGILDRLADASR